jgi:hypothetical protein
MWKLGELEDRRAELGREAAGEVGKRARRLGGERERTLLSEARFREAALPYLPAPTRRFFRERFPRLPEEAITPVTNLIDRLRASTPLACLLGQPSGGYRAREAMDRGQIVLACPGSGGSRDRLIANFLVFDLLHAARARAQAPAAGRRLFFCFLDEVQTYDGASAGQLAALLEQTAKYGLRAVLLNQNPERLSAQTLAAIATNRSHLAVTALGAGATPKGARERGWRGHYPTFPGVLVVLADRPRRLLERRRDAAIALSEADPELTRAEVSVSICLLDDLAERGPFAPIFARPAEAERAVNWLGEPDEPTSGHDRRAS